MQFHWHQYAAGVPHVPAIKRRGVVVLLADAETHEVAAALITDGLPVVGAVAEALCLILGHASDVTTPPGVVVLTEDRQSARDQRFVATLESLIELVWDCACKRPAKSQVRDTRLNGERQQGFCRFCGALAELTSFAGGSDDPKADDPEEKLRLSSLYCLDHRPKLPNGAWNPSYRQARRSLAQFDLELARLSQQCAKPATPQVKSGDQLVDSYFFHYVAGQTFQPADKAELRNQARLMVDSKLSDRKKQMLMLQWSGLNQSEIARKLGIERQAVSKALASIPAMFHLSSKSRSRRQPN